MPLGWVAKPGGGERLAGVPLLYLLFALSLGKAGFGKTEMSLVQAIALAHCGHGILFLDPHGDGWQRARPYLAHDHLMDRIWEIDLTSPDLDQMVASWNPLSMQNRHEADIPDIVQYIVTGFSSALNWGDSAGRAKTILTQAVKSLVELSLLLSEMGQPGLAPTVFQIRTILTDEEWRDTIVPYLSKELRDFWTKTFPKYPGMQRPWSRTSSSGWTRQTPSRRCSVPARRRTTSGPPWTPGKSCSSARRARETPTGSSVP